ncbi:MAG TPA: AMP-binding protein [Acidimicrobiales bacterium]|nr:AMP-binding protein [Acidimicrobiales bacterium]
MAPTTLAQLFAAGRRRAGDGGTLLETPAGRRLTHGEAHARAGAAAAALRDAGVGPGDRVALAVEKSPEAMVVYLAAVTTGAVVLPLNPAYSDDEVGYILSDAEPAVVIADPGRRRPPATAAPWFTLDGEGAGTWSEAQDGAEGVEPGALRAGGGEPGVPQPDDPAVLLYTSGTTGRPKGAVLSQWNLAANVEALRQVWGFVPGDRLLHALPIYHAHGLLVGVNLTLATGSSMWWLPRFQADAVVGGLAHATVMMGVPTYYRRLLDHPGLDREACAGVRLFVSGSAPLPPRLFAEWERRTGHRIVERYGMTETVMIASNPLDGERRPGTVGLPLPGVEVAVRHGEVWVRGPSVLRGYWKRAPAVDGDGWFATGDLGDVDGDGYLHLRGRSKDLVITGGLNVYPKEVEEVLDAVPGVAESAVVGVPDDDLGEAVTAVVVAEAGARLDADAVRQAARSRLAGYKLPRSVVIVDSLPRNAMGKVEKEKIRRRLTSPEHTDGPPS